VNIVEQTVAWLTDPANWQGPNGIPTRLEEHVAISLVSMVIAIAIAVPAGSFVGHTGRGGSVAVNLANLGRALPSLAVIGIVVPITQAIDPQAGFRVYPTLVAMVVLALPVILVNTYTGIRGVDRDLVEAARGMGLRERQIFRSVELPLGLGVIIGGTRSASVTVIATATLGAIFGFGGLGRYLVDGIAQNDDGQVWGGVVLVAGLALVTEGLLAVVQRRTTPAGFERPPAVSSPMGTEATPAT
jgi:osmoprotectant transport system permease protein